MGEHLYLAHHGIKGQKWGVRRFQNEDGSLTSAGRSRYGVIGSTKAYFKRRRENVDRFYKQTGDYVHDKMPNQMTAEERARYEKADAQYKKAQKEAGRKYREDLKTGASDRVKRITNSAPIKNARQYADRNKKIAREYFLPSDPTRAQLSALGGAIFGYNGRASYAYDRGQAYVSKKYGDDAAMRMQTTDRAVAVVAGIGSAVYASWRMTHPTYED